MAPKKKVKKAPSGPRRVRDVNPERVRRFVECFMGEAAGVGAQAARLAGWQGSNKALSERASRLLQRPDVVAMMQARAEEQPETWTRKELQEFWTKTARGDKAPTLVEGVVVDAPPPWAARIAASLALGRAQGVFIERKELTINGRVIVEARMPSRDPPPLPAAEDA